MAAFVCAVILSLLGAFPASAQSLAPEPACRTSGQQDVFILLDISGSMFTKNLVPTCLDFIKSKLAELNSGRIDVVAFSTDWVQLHSQFDADFHVLIRPDDPNARSNLLWYLDPKTYGAPAKGGNWKGLLAAARSKSSGTDIGLAVHRALANLEQRVSEPGYLTNSSGLQLWVLTDSDEESKSHALADLLKRMQRLRTHLWFQYREIVLLKPASLSSQIHLRHIAITNAGFVVDYTENLKQRVRIPQPWPATSGKAEPLIGSYQIPCGATPGEYEIQFEPSLVFDTCGERGERVPGRFRLTARPITNPSSIALLMPQELPAESFGKPISSFRVKGDWDKFPAGTSAESTWTLDYAFEPAAPGVIIDYLAQPQTSVRLKIQKPSSPEIQWKIIKASEDPNACYASPAAVARIELVSTRLTAPTRVDISLVSLPPGALRLDQASLTISPDSPTARLNVIAGDTDATNATSTLSLRASSTGDCPALVSPAEQKLSACFLAPQLNWRVIAKAGAAKSKCFTPGEMVAEVVVTATNLTASADVVVELDSEPPGALGFGGSNVSKTLAPGSPSHVVKVFAGNTDAVKAKGVVRLRGSVARGRSLRISPAQETTISACFVQRPMLEWIAAGGNRVPAPSSVRLRASKDKDAVWNYEKPTNGGLTELFVLTLPEPADEQNAFQISIEDGGLKYAVDLQEQGQQSSGATRSMRASTQGSHVFRLATKSGADSGSHTGRLKVIPSRGQLLNGTNEVSIPIEIFFAPPPKD